MRRVSAVGLLVVLLSLVMLARGPRPVLAQAPMDDYNPTEDQHLVEEGDTLWDLCDKVLGKAWYWPRVWALNPEITNPHWIYPGDVIRFFPSTLELPNSALLASGQVKEITEKPRDELDVGEAMVGPKVEMIETRPRVRRRPERSASLFVGAFVTSLELEESGRLSNAAPDKIMLSSGDTIYITKPKGKEMVKGDRLMVYRMVRPISHPVTHKSWGFITEVTGLARVESVDKAVIQARLEKTVLEVERGQYVTPLVQDPRMTVRATPAKTAVAGVVLGVRDGGVAGAEQLVFVDKGKNDGLERGAKLHVLKTGDPFTGDKVGFIPVNVATLMVMDIKDTASTCLIISSVREIEPGDEVKTLLR